MLSKLRVSPYGVNDELKSVEMNILNDEIENALDAINGGVYVGLGAISWEGAWTFAGAGGVTVFETSVFWSNGATFNGAAEFNSTLALNGVTTVNNDITITGSGTLLAVAASATTPTFASGIHVTAGTTTLDGSAICNDTLSVHNNFLHDTGTAAFSSNVAFSGPTSLTGRMSITSGGNVAYRYIVGADATTTYGVADADLIRVPTMTAPRTYVITSTGAALGNTMEIILDVTTGTDLLTLVRDDVSSIGGPLQRGTRQYAKLVFDGVNWQRMFQGAIP